MVKKTKFQEMLEKTKEKLKSQEESKGFNKENKEYTQFFNPNILLKTKKNVKARILPIQGANSLCVTYPNHKFKIGSNMFNLICAHATLNKDKEYGSCPICNFLKDNNGEIERTTYGKLMARDTHLCYVWNYDMERIEKWNFDNTMFSQLVELLIENDITDDSDGIDISFKKTEDGKYYEIKDVSAPENNIDEFLDEIGIEEIPNIVDNELTFSPTYIVKRLADTLKLAVNTLIPDTSSLDLSSLENIKTTNTTTIKKSSKKTEEDEEELFEEKPKNNKNKSKPIKIEDDVDEFDSMFDEGNTENNEEEEEEPF